MRLEKIPEVNEIFENSEYTELLNEKTKLEEQLKKAVSEKNTEAKNYYGNKLEKLEAEISEFKANGEIWFGASENEWRRKAAEEYAKHGESQQYKEYLKRAGKEHVKKQLDK